MGISNVGSGLRPGICTSTTRPTTPYEGQMIYETDTDLSYVWNGSAWTQTFGGNASGNSGLVYIAGTTVTSSTSYVEMLNVFSSLYDNYRFVINNVQSTSNQGFQFYLGTNATSGLHYGSIYYDQYTGSSTNTARTNGGNRSFIGLSDSAGANGGYSFDLNAPYLTKQKTFHGTYNGRNYSGWCGGLIADSASYTGIRFINESGNITAGTFRVYGYRN